MRWLNTATIIILVVAILIFALQNLENVTLSFLGFRITAPLALQIIIVYLLGMATGGSTLALVRWAWQGPKESE
ncbi:MAG: hypothetical protein BGP04_12910 [Rhizobiales bacterium 62-17]|nr:hypothetical protein [Hyphomicrobiales bacterium]OJY02448.1 MAG: hypothetical protein BGP04_12910 [Rhizobiales bacterium 62-17]